MRAHATGFVIAEKRCVRNVSLFETTSNIALQFWTKRKNIGSSSTSRERLAAGTVPRDATYVQNLW